MYEKKTIPPNICTIIFLATYKIMFVRFFKDNCLLKKRKKRAPLVHL